MKQIRLLSLVWVILTAWILAGCTKNNGDFVIEEISTDAVIEYNDKLVDYASNCFIADDVMWNVYDDESSTANDIHNAIDDAAAECNNSINLINSLWARDWDTSLQEAVLFILNKDIEYYQKLDELLSYAENQQNLTEQDEIAYNQILDEINAINNEILNANEDLITVQELFAENHGYTLQTIDEEIE